MPSTNIIGILEGKCIGGKRTNNGRNFGIMNDRLNDSVILNVNCRVNGVVNGDSVLLSASAAVANFDNVTLSLL